MGTENEKVRAGAAKKTLETMVKRFELYFHWRNLPLSPDVVTYLGKYVRSVLSPLVSVLLTMLLCDDI